MKHSAQECEVRVFLIRVVGSLVSTYGTARYGTSAALHFHYALHDAAKTLFAALQGGLALVSQN